MDRHRWAPRGGCPCSGSASDALQPEIPAPSPYSEPDSGLACLSGVSTGWPARQASVSAGKVFGAGSAASRRVGARRVGFELLLLRASQPGLRWVQESLPGPRAGRACTCLSPQPGCPKGKQGGGLRDQSLSSPACRTHCRVAPDPNMLLAVPTDLPSGCLLVHSLSSPQAKPRLSGVQGCRPRDPCVLCQPHGDWGQGRGALPSCAHCKEGPAVPFKWRLGF